MIKILTFLLGLTWGPQPIELGVVAPVHRVEVRLDGTVVEVLEAPPWQAEVDFGTELAPRLLEAVAFDSKGNEIDRTTRSINLSLPQSQAELLVEQAPSGQGSSAKLVWQSMEHSEPERIEVWFDGEPLTVEDPTQIALPPYKLSKFHVLSAEVSFPGGSRSRSDVAFGGAFGEAVSTENTAVPIAVTGRRSLRKRQQAEGLVLAKGQPKSVLALEHGRVDFVAVVDRSALPSLSSLGFDLRQREEETAGSLNGVSVPGLDRSPTRREVPRGPLFSAGLRSDDRFFLVLPAPDRRTPQGASYEVFPISTPLTSEEGGSAYLLAHYRLADDLWLRQKLAKAVAVAGIHAASGRRPRVVLLVLGSDPQDTSEIDPDLAERFLRRLGVPLKVWFVAKSYRELRKDERRDLGITDDPEVDREAGIAFARERDQQLAQARETWGEVEDIDSLDALVEAATALRKELSSQRVIWVDGLHLPAEIDLADQRAGAVLLTSQGNATIPP